MHSNVWSLSLQRSGLKFLPPSYVAMLKSLSTGAEEAGTSYILKGYGIYYMIYCRAQNFDRENLDGY